MTPQTLANQVLKKNKLALAKFITLLENRDKRALEQLAKLYPKTGKAIRIGITGPQGVGKSTLLNRLIEHAVKNKNKVGVLAVDPSSALHGGAFLGDRVRMQKQTSNKNVFIRSMATRTNTRGLSPAVYDAATALDAYGCDYIFIETIGIGQDEIEVTRIVDLSVLVLSPDFGDKFQALKAGITETCDVIVVNKIDLPRSKQAIATLKETHSRPVLGVCAKKGSQITALMNKIHAQFDAMQKSELLNFRRNNQKRSAVKERLEEELIKQLSRFWTEKKTQSEINKMIQRNKNINQIARKVKSLFQL